MKMRFSFVLLSVPLLAAILSAQVVQPAAVPAWPADVTYQPDRTYHVAPDGSDRLADGSLARPFRTFQRAVQQIHWDRGHGHGPKLAEIAYRADGTYSQSQNVSENDLVIDSYPASPLATGPATRAAVDPEQRPTITSTDTAFLWLNAKNIHLQNLRIAGDPEAGGNHGVYINGGDDISLDYCEVDGFKLFDLCLIGGATHVRLHHNFIANAFNPTKGTMSCSGLYSELVSPDVQCNIFYHNGWKAPFDLKDDAWIQAMMFRHGWYENPASGAIGGIDRFNLYLRNAATGHQCRAGNGNVQWGVFWDNGNAADVFTGPGANHNLGGEIGHCAFFGNLTKDFASWGGGAVGQSAADTLHDLLFASPSTAMGIQPAITIAWSGNANDNFPMPARATASVTNCRGIWPTGDLVILNGRKADVVNVRIRKPKAGEHVPALTDFFNTKDDEAIAQLLRTHLHNQKYSAQAIIDWTGRSLPAN